MAALAAFGLSLAGAAVAQTQPDTLRFGTTFDPPGLNPLVYNNAQVTFLGVLVHGFLLRTDAEGRLIPDLATVVPTRANGGISADGRLVTYHLRRHVRWQDGAPFDAGDVAFSFRAAMNPRNNVPDRTGFDHVTDVEIVDPHTVRLHLSNPFSPFVASAFTLGANDPYPILPAHLLAREADLNAGAYNAKPVGLGPYKLTSWQRGARLVFEADPHYFRGAPKIAKIEVTIIPSIQTLVTLWQTHQVDLIVVRSTAGRAAYDAVRAVPNAHTVVRSHAEFDFLQFNHANPVLADAAVRHAIVQSIDRTRIMTELGGDLWGGTQGDRLPGQFAYDPALRQPPYDPAAASRTLDAAGWVPANGVRRKGGRELSFTLVGTSNQPATERFNLLVQQNLAQIGIKTTIRSYDYGIMWATAAAGGIYQTGRFDLSYNGWQPGSVNDHSYLFRCDTRPPAGDNSSRICDPFIDAAARRELSSVDPAEEAAADRAITRRLVAHSDILFLGFNREAVAYRDGLEGVEPAYTGLHFWNAWDWRFRPAR